MSFMEEESGDTTESKNIEHMLDMRFELFLVQTVVTVKF